MNDLCKTHQHDRCPLHSWHCKSVLCDDSDVVAMGDYCEWYDEEDNDE